MLLHAVEVNDLFVLAVEGEHFFCYHLLLLLSLLLHLHVRFQRVRIRCQSNREVVQRCVAARQHFSVALLAPRRAPRVLNDPRIAAVRGDFPPDNLHDMRAIVFERILRPVIGPLLIRQEICVRRNLR